jgi:ankyrin repeat protein
VECLDCDGQSALHDACRTAEALVPVFLKFGVDESLADRNGNTPLGLAIQSGFLEGVVCLLPLYAARSLLNGSNGDGESYLHLACRQEDPVAMASLLLSNKELDVNFVSYLTHETPIFLALETSFELFQLFLADKRGNLNARDRHGTPLIVLFFQRAVSARIVLVVRKAGR